jgi:2-aminoadipate transaminase
MPHDDRDIQNRVAGGGWTPLKIDRFLSASARSIGVSTSTDLGWSPPPPEGVVQIRMSGGIPDEETLPAEDLLAALGPVLMENAAEALRYGGTMGYEELRRSLAAKSGREDAIEQTPDNILLTNGSSAAIEVIARTFLDPGDVVVTESPTFSGSLRTFRGQEARLVAVSVDVKGMSSEDLERVLADLVEAGTPAKMIYSIPDFHNPTGTYMTLERRVQCVEIARRFGALIIEDAAYADLYFSVEPLPSLYAVAGGEGVLRVGSFSKTIATGVRVGWVQGQADFVNACNQMRFDMGSSPILHRALATYLDSGKWEDHAAEMRELYSQKCAILCEALIDECEPYMRFERPEGGYFLWLECAEGLSARAVAQAAAEEGLSCVPGGVFYLDRGDDRHIRLAFSYARLAELAEAARRLRRAFERVAG